MSWTNYFPVLTDEMVEQFRTQASPEEKHYLEQCYGLEALLNKGGTTCERKRIIPPLYGVPIASEKKHVVSFSLFWKSDNIETGPYPQPTPGLMQKAIELGLCDGVLKEFSDIISLEDAEANTPFDDFPNEEKTSENPLGYTPPSPWSRLVSPLLREIPRLYQEYPEIVFRVYLANDLKFLADELAASGCEVHLMKGSSIHHSPGALWRYLPLQEENFLTTIVNISQVEDLEPLLKLTAQLNKSGHGFWRLPDQPDSKEASYFPIHRKAFGAVGLNENVDELLRAFTWWISKPNRRNIFMSQLASDLAMKHFESWPNKGLDHLFLASVLYPRLALSGCISYVNPWLSSIFLALDVEYVTWASEDSEVVINSTPS